MEEEVVELDIGTGPGRKKQGIRGFKERKFDTTTPLQRRINKLGEYLVKYPAFRTMTDFEKYMGWFDDTQIFNLHLPTLAATMSYLEDVGGEIDPAHFTVPTASEYLDRYIPDVIPPEDSGIVLDTKTKEGIYARFFNYTFYVLKARSK